MRLIKVMTPVSNEIIETAIQILGTKGISQEDIETRVRALTSDDITARRIIDWIPEAFGRELISRLPAKIIIPETFSAKTANDRWVSLKLVQEPIYTAAFAIAQKMFQQGGAEQELHMEVAFRSSSVDMVNNALNAGTDLDGACVSGPALIGIPAEVYGAPSKTSFWQRVFGR